MPRTLCDMRRSMLPPQWNARRSHAVQRAAILCARRTFLSAQRRQLTMVEEVALPRDLVFKVVADVARYHEFVPFCGTSEIIAQHSRDSFDARLSLGFLAFTEEYVSRVQLSPPFSVVAEASGTPLFSHLRTEWRFDDGGASSTRLHFHLDMQLRSVVHDQALRTVIDRVASEQMAAFKKRCHTLHATATDGTSRADSAATAEAASASAADATGAAFAAACAPATAAAAAAAAAADSAARLPAAFAPLQVEPAWRQKVDAAFDAHALDGERLTLPRFVEACRALGVSKRELHSWFVQFDEDASGGVDRCEFVRNLWVLSRASEDERRAFVFRRLDMNGSGALEREDLSQSMRRQLGLARRLVPILVRQQMRREATANLASARNAAAAAAPAAATYASGASSAANGAADGSSATRVETSRQRAMRLREEAAAVACAAIDELDAQVDSIVCDVFASFGSGVERIDFEMWCDAWDTEGVQRLHAGMGGVLGAILQHRSRIDET